MEFSIPIAPSAAQRSLPRKGGRLLLLGDFSAKPASQKPPLAQRQCHRVDFDTVDEVMSRLSPELAMAAGVVSFEKLDDFHPEQLYARVPLFDELRQARSKPIGSAGLLDQLLGKTPAATSAHHSATETATAKTGLDSLLRQLVTPHIVPDQSTSLQAQQAAVDAVITEHMRRLLHEPAFQQLESAWRGVQWLIANLELNEGLELHLLDVSREELLADVIGAQGQPAQTGLHRALLARADAQYWSVLVGLYEFSASAVDVGMLAALGLLAEQAGAPLLAGGAPGLATLAPSEQARWQALRQSQAAPWLGLAAPRLLLRLPYGKKSDPVAGFDFEEFDAAPVHEEFLWGNGALAVSLLMGRAFNTGQECTGGQISDLPAYSFLQGGERELQACAEHFLSEEAGLNLLGAGLMPLLSHRHRNAVTIPRLQSVAESAPPLAGLEIARSPRR